MRYMKTYESFGNPFGNSPRDRRIKLYSFPRATLLLEIEDILRELEDNNIRVEVYFWDGVEVFLTSRNEHEVRRGLLAPDTFPYEVIKPNIEHLVSFLDEIGYKIKSIHNIVNLESRGSITQYPDLDGEEIGRLEFRFIK
jgi:hypothetical protein